MLRAVCNSNGCQRVRNHHTPSPRLQFFWDLYLMREGGYPFGPDDLRLEEWKLLGEFTMIRKELERGR